MMTLAWYVRKLVIILFLNIQLSRIRAYHRHEETLFLLLFSCTEALYYFTMCLYRSLSVVGSVIRGGEALVKKMTHKSFGVLFLLHTLLTKHCKDSSQEL